MVAAGLDDMDIGPANGLGKDLLLNLNREASKERESWPFIRRLSLAISPGPSQHDENN
jgi:hypothetical protein